MGRMKKFYSTLLFIGGVLTLISSLLFLLPACGTASQEAANLKNEPSQSGSKQNEVPTPRMLALAHILSGKWVENEWFVEEDVMRVKGIEFLSEDSLASHRRFFDRIRSPKTCSVERVYLNHGGDTERTEVISINCVDYWNMIREVDAFFEQRGFLPVSSQDLESLRMIENSKIFED